MQTRFGLGSVVVLAGSCLFAGGCFDWDALSSGGPPVMVDAGSLTPLSGPSSAAKDDQMPMICLTGQNFNKQTAVTVNGKASTLVQFSEEGKKLCFRLPVNKGAVGPAKIVVTTNVKFPVEVPGFSYYLGTVKFEEKPALSSTAQPLKLNTDSFVMKSAQFGASGKPADLLFVQNKDTTKEIAEVWTLQGKNVFQKTLGNPLLTEVPAGVAVADFDGNPSTQEVAIVTKGYKAMGKDAYELHVLAWNGAFAYVVSGGAGLETQLAGGGGITVQGLLAGNVDGTGAAELLVQYQDTMAAAPKLDIFRRTAAVNMPFAKDAMVSTDLSAGLLNPLSFVAMGDVNNDGKADLVLGAMNAVSWRQSTSSATALSFAASQPALGLGGFVPGMAGFLLPLASQKAPSLFLSGTSAGKPALGVGAPAMSGMPFGAVQSFDTGSQATSVMTADLNQDGKMDAVVLAGKTLLWLLQDPAKSDGSWLTPGSFSPPSCANMLGQMALLDVNQDSNLDVVVTCTGTTDVYVLNNISE